MLTAERSACQVSARRVRGLSAFGATSHLDHRMIELKISFKRKMSGIPQSRHENRRNRGEAYKHESPRTAANRMLARGLTLCRVCVSRLDTALPPFYLILGCPISRICDSTSAGP